MNCFTCPNTCCGSIPDLIPVLFPLEENQYEADKHKTEFYTLQTLKIKNGRCIYFNSNRCSIYDSRPLECRFYPYLLDFSKLKTDIDIKTRNEGRPQKRQWYYGSEIDFKLDSRFCSDVPLKPKINFYIPTNWIEAYMLLSPKFNGGI